MSDGVYEYDPSQIADQFDATANLGPPLAGACAQMYLYGIFISKFYRYVMSKQHRNNSNFDRWFIWTVAVFLSITTAFNCFVLAWHAVTQNRTLQSIYMVEVPDALAPVWGGTVNCLVQSYLAVRASRLFHKCAVRRFAFLGSVFTLIVVSWAAAVINCVATLSFTYNFQELLGPFNYSVSGALWTSTAAVIDMAVSLTLYLHLRGTIQGFNKSTDGAVKRLMTLALRTAAPTTFLQVTGAVLAVAFGTVSAEYSVVWLAFATPLSSLYALSLLTTLNSRRPIKRQQAVVGSNSWLGSGAAFQGEDEKGVKPSFVRRTISRMSSYNNKLKPPSSPAADLTASGITFTRDVVEEIEAGDDYAPRIDSSRPYLESYLEVPKTFARARANDF